MSWENWFSIYKSNGQSGAEKYHRRLKKNSSKIERLGRHVGNDDVIFADFRCLKCGRQKYMKQDGGHHNTGCA